MKLTGARQANFLSHPPADIIGILLFGPDRGLAKSRAAALSRLWLPEADADFGATILTADDLSADPSKLADEMSALSLLGGARLVRLRLDHERQAAAISKTLKDLDANPHKAEAKLIIEAGDLTPRSAIRKMAEAAKHFAAIGCYPANARDLREQITTGLAERFIGIEPNALDFWTPLLEGDFALAAGEIEKMALYKGYGESENASETIKVTMDDILAVAAGGQSASIDAIITAAMSGQLDSCDAGYRRAVAGKINPVTILFSLQRHLMRLTEAATKMEAGESASSAVKSLRPPVFRMQEGAFLSQLNRWPARALRGSITRCQEAERMVKSTGAPSEAIVSRLLLALASFANRRAA
jgi:DNA polymerase-3 subunit delta